MGNRPIISFCIPTYNRCELVVKCVSEILKYNGDEIEVVVSNNASDDNTKVELEKIKDSRLKLFSNSENLGFTKNYILTLERAKGEFCFTLSDEDTTFADTISRLIEVVNNATEGVIYTSPYASLKNRETGEVEEVTIRNYEKEGKYEFNKLDAIEAIFIESYITGYILRRDAIPFDFINSDACPDLNVYPQIFINLLLNDKCGTKFLKETFVQLGWIAEKTFILDEKTSVGESYLHPLSRLAFIKCHIEWIRILNLNDSEKIEMIFRVYKMGLKRATWAYSDTIKSAIGDIHQDIKMKVTSEECGEICKYYIELGRSMMDTTESPDDYEIIVLKLSNEFSEKTIG